MSSSDEEIDTKTAQEHVIKPAKGGAQLDTSNWPLLLKVRTIYNHFKWGRQTIKYSLFLFSIHFIKNTLISFIAELRQAEREN